MNYITNFATSFFARMREFDLSEVVPYQTIAVVAAGLGAAVLLHIGERRFENRDVPEPRLNDELKGRIRINEEEIEERNLIIYKFLKAQIVMEQRRILALDWELRIDSPQRQNPIRDQNIIYIDPKPTNAAALEIRKEERKRRCLKKEEISAREDVFQKFLESVSDVQQKEIFSEKWKRQNTFSPPENTFLGQNSIRFREREKLTVCTDIPAKQIRYGTSCLI